MEGAVAPAIPAESKSTGIPPRIHASITSQASVANFIGGTTKQFELEMKSLLQQEMIKQGIFMSVLGASFISYSHSESDIEKTLSSLEKTCEFIVKNVKNENYKKFIEGNLPKTIWRMKILPTKKSSKV